MVLARAARILGLEQLPHSLRPIALGGSLSSVGSGLWYTTWALFFVRHIGLSAGQTGLAMAVAGAVGFVSPVPCGRVADRHGARGTYGALLAFEGLAVLSFLACHSFAAIVAAAAATAAADQGKTGVRTALVAQLAGERHRVSALASLRACSHAGDAIGAALGGLVIQLDSTAAYDAAIGFNALTYLAYAVAVTRVPAVPAGAVAARGPRLGAFSDVPYVALAAICGVLTLCWGLASAGLPLWTAGHTEAPRAVAGLVVGMSSLTIAGLQVRFSRGVTTPAAGARAAWRAGVSLAACCMLFAAAGGPSASPAAALLVAGGVAHVLGELWFVAASWGLSVPLMDERRAAEYQSVFATGEALATMLAPALMTAVVVPAGATGWALLGTAFFAAGAAARPAVGWALSTGSRPHRRPVDAEHVTATGGSA